MIRIGVLADTHLAERRNARFLLAKLAERHFPGVAMILHAGDIVEPGLLTALLPTPVYAVRGNMDPSTADTPPKRVIAVGGLQIGLIHGWGSPAGILTRIRQEFSDVQLDCLVFGHTHEPYCRREDGLLLFNPGSATDRRHMPYESVGLLEIEGGKISGRIISVSC